MFLLTGPRTILRRLIGMIEVAVGNFCVGVDATSLGSNAERYIRNVNAA
jgi:hypothetical protein